MTETASHYAPSVEEPEEEEKPDAPVDGVVVAEDMVPAEQYGKLKGEYDALKGELELLKKEIEAMKAPKPEEMPEEEPKPEEDPAVTEAKAQLVAIKAELAELVSLDPEERIRIRIDKYDNMGKFEIAE